MQTIPRITLTVTILLVALIGSLGAQTLSWQQTNGPEGGAVQALARDGAGRIYVGIFGQGLLRSAEGGTWTTLPLVLPKGLVSSVVAARNGSIFVASSEGPIFRSTDDGVTWDIVLDTIRGGTMLTEDSSGGIIAGTSEGIFRSTDDGATWLPLGDSGLNYPTVIATGPGGIIIAGLFESQTSNQGLIYRSIDSGATWSSVEPNSVWTGRFTALSVVRGGTILAGTHYEIVRSTDSGATWQRAVTGDRALPSVWAIAQAPDDRIYAVGLDSILVSTDDGLTWKATGRTPTAVMPVGLTITPDGALYVGSVDAGVFRSIDSGRTWTESNRGFRKTPIGMLAAGNDGVLVAANLYHIYHTTDRGDSWSRGTIGQSNAPRVLAAAPNGYFYAGVVRSIGGGILRSTDDGHSWSVVDTGYYGIMSMAFDPRGDVYIALNNGQILRSTDSGTTWNPLTDALPGTALQTMAINSAHHIIGCTPQGQIFHISTATGARTPLTPQWTLGITTIAAGPGQTMYAGTSSAGVYRSTDDGATWQKSSLHFEIADAFISGIVIDREGRIFATAANRGIFRSIDSGFSWVKVSEPFGNGVLTAMVIDSSGYIYVGTEEDAVFRSTVTSGIRELPPVAASEGLSGEARDISLTCAPNPFDRSMEARFSIPAAGHATVVLIDELGRTVAVPFDGDLTAGDHVVSIDGAGLPSGIYLCRLSMGAIVATERIVLRR